jgi:hypothetical protein
VRRDFTKITFSVFIALVFVVLFSTFYFLLSNSAIAQNGSLYLSPSSGQVSVGQTFSLVLRVNTGGTAINAAEGSVVFDQSKFTITSISKSGSVFTIWAEEPKFSNAEGTIEFAGGLPNPGYSGSNGLVMTIAFKAKTATTVSGSTDITFVSGGILANDGYGTNILSSLGKATYSISPGVITPTPIPGEREISVPTVSRVNVTSQTHPDSSKWYSNNNPLFKWDVPSGVSEVISVLSRRANSPPIISYSPPISEKLLTDLGEGEWYLNARFRTSAGLGPITSFKFNIDTQVPLPFSITRLDTDDPTNPRPELLFESSDITSGIDHYEFVVNDTEPIVISVSDAGRSYVMPLQTPGEKNLEIKAFDRAGNSTLALLTVKVESIDVPHLNRVSEKVREGEGLIVEGTAKPDQKVIIFAQHINGNLQNTYETTTDANGKFTLAITGLPIGKYTIYAKAQDERGAVSNPSNDMSAEVRGGFLDFIFRIFDWFVNVLSGGGLFIAFIAALVGLILVLIELIKIRAGKWLKKAKDFIIVKVIKKKSAKKVDHIIKNMQDEIKLLSQIAKRRSLSTEEKYLKAKVTSYIKMLKSIDKEL